MQYGTAAATTKCQQRKSKKECQEVGFNVISTFISLIPGFHKRKRLLASDFGLSWDWLKMKNYSGTSLSERYALFYDSMNRQFSDQEAKDSKVQTHCHFHLSIDCSSVVASTAIYHSCIDKWSYTDHQTA